MIVNFVIILHQNLYFILILRKNKKKNIEGTQVFRLIFITFVFCKRTAIIIINILPVG